MKNYIIEKFNNIYFDIKIDENIFLIIFFNENKNNLIIFYLIKNNKFNFNIIFEKIKNNIFDFNGKKIINFTGDIYSYDLSEIKSNIYLAKYTGVKTDKINISLVCDTDKEYNPNKNAYFIGYNNWTYSNSLLALYMDSVLRIEQNNINIVPVTFEQILAFHQELNTDYFVGNMPERLRYEYTDNSEQKNSIYINGKYLKQNFGSPANMIRKYYFQSGRYVDAARLNEKQSDATLNRQAGLLGYNINENQLKGENKTETELLNTISNTINNCFNIKNIVHDKNYAIPLKLKGQILKDYPELIYEKINGEGKENYKPDINSEKIRNDRITVNSTSAQIVANCLCPYGKLKDMDTVSFMYPSKSKAEKLGIQRINILDQTYEFIRNRMRPLVKDEQGKDILCKLKEVLDMYKTIEGKNFNNELPNPEKLNQYIKSINVAYMDKNGRYSDCYVTFSAGGIHGSQYNINKYNEDVEKNIRNELFPKDKNGETKLAKRYTLTSFGETNHEDFISYYTNLLCNMEAFKNEYLDYDRYAEIFQNKEYYGKLMKNTNLPQDQRELYSIMRENTKLLLISATGAADVNYPSSIKMNNKIISMRIIGQLFTWRIGQAQALAGAKIISTNTDGLYTIMDEQENNIILKKESENIKIGIEPERIYLISKDTNNRLEGIYNKHKNNVSGNITITGTSGINLNAFNGSITTKAPNHPAITDWVLSEILKEKALNGNMDDFDNEKGIILLTETALKHFSNRREYMKMFQHIIYSSHDKYIYNFALKSPYLSEKTDLEPIKLQDCNRIFYVVPENIPEQYHDRIVYLASAYIYTGRNNIYKCALKVIKDIYKNDDALSAGTPKIKKINGIEFNTPCFIANDDIDNIPINSEWLNYDYYNYVVRKTYKNSWQNNVELIDI